MGGAGLGESSTGAPEVAVQDEHRGGDRPAEKDLAVATDFLVGEDAMSTFFDPINNILATAWPEEAHPNTEQSLANAEVAADRAAVEHVEDKAAQGGGHDDKQKRSTGLKALTHDQAAMMDAEVVIASELLEGWVEAGDNCGAPSETRREMAEQSIGGKVGGIRRGPGGGGW
jgi:hypothetical protein